MTLNKSETQVLLSTPLRNVYLPTVLITIILYIFAKQRISIIMYKIFLKCTVNKILKIYYFLGMIVTFLLIVLLFYRIESQLTFFTVFFLFFYSVKKLLILPIIFNKSFCTYSSIFISKIH